MTNTLDPQWLTRAARLAWSAKPRIKVTGDDVEELLRAALPMLRTMIENDLRGRLCAAVAQVDPIEWALAGGWAGNDIRRDHPGHSMTEPEPPLFPDAQPCGCPRGEGHRCPPNFKTLEQVRAKYVPIRKAA